MSLEDFGAPDLVFGDGGDLVKFEENAEHQTGVPKDAAVDLSFDRPTREASTGIGDSLGGLIQKHRLLGIAPVPSDLGHATDHQLFFGQVEPSSQRFWGCLVEGSRDERRRKGGWLRHGGEVEVVGRVALYVILHCAISGPGYFSVTGICYLLLFTIVSAGAGCFLTDREVGPAPIPVFFMSTGHLLEGNKSDRGETADRRNSRSLF